MARAQKSRPEQTRRSRIRLKLRDPKGAAVRGRAVALLLEHQPVAAEQVRIETDQGDQLEAEVPAGDFTVQVYAPGYEVDRRHVHLPPGKDSEVDVRLTPRKDKFHKPTLQQRLAPYGLAEAARDLQDLRIRPGESMVLDRRYSDDRVYRELRARSIADIKRWLGSPDNVLGHGQPKFGPSPRAELLPREDAQHLSSAELTADERTALSAVSREYIHGNSKAVSKYASVIDGYFLRNFAEGLLIPIFLFSVVEIGAGATLEIGASSSVFFASTLRIHATGVLSVVGTVKADIGTYERFT
jgi:hypothetical protein